MELRRKLYYYRDNKRKIESLQEKIIYLRTKAEKITPTLSPDESKVFISNNDSKIERNVIKIIEIEKELKQVQNDVVEVDDFFKTLKPYQRYIVRSCIVNHIPYSVIAKKEKTTPQNISKIVQKVLQIKNP